VSMNCTQVNSFLEQRKTIHKQTEGKCTLWRRRMQIYASRHMFRGTDVKYYCVTFQVVPITPTQLV